MAVAAVTGCVGSKTESMVNGQGSINAVKSEPGMEDNSSGNVPMMNNTQNATNASKNIISIPLEKPPFIKD